jgi:hypothetical protein
MTALLDLPPELINVVVGHLAPSSAVPLNEAFDSSQSCPCIPQEDPNRQLVLYNAELEHLRKGYETDVLRLGMAHPYIAQCISHGGWRGVVDAMWLKRRKDLGVIPCVPEELRGVIRYVITSCSIALDLTDVYV